MALQLAEVPPSPPPDHLAHLQSTLPRWPPSDPSSQRTDPTHADSGPDRFSTTAAPTDSTAIPPNPTIFCLCGHIDGPHSSTSLPPNIPAILPCTTCPGAQHTLCLFNPSKLPDLSRYRCPYCDPKAHTKRLKKHNARLWNDYVRELWDACGRHLWPYYSATVLHHNPHDGEEEPPLEPPDLQAS